MDKYFKNSKGFIIGTIGVSALFIGTAFILNYLVDPLWYKSGNRLSPKNFAFNERISKTNLFFKNNTDYNCIVFGSSRATLLDSRRLKKGRCFNFSFSAGKINEFLEYAEYLSSQGISPDYVIVGVDGFNFWETELKSQTPEFVINRESPPGLIKNYLSADALYFSIKTILQQSPFPRYYNSEFIGSILQDAPTYEPPQCFNVRKPGKKFQLERVELYSRFRDIWPQAQFIGYVPPIIAWDFVIPYNDKTLDGYLEALFQTASLYNEFYDFSVPSELTAKPELTYDGDHYNLATNNRILSVLNGESDLFGLNLKALSKRNYKTQFFRSVRDFIGDSEIVLSKNKECEKMSRMRNLF